MNEDENGITPASVTAMTVEPETVPGEFFVTIERGNGDSVQTVHLTKMECHQLAFLLERVHPPFTGPSHIDFVDVTR